MVNEEEAIKALEANIKNLENEHKSYPEKKEHNEKLLKRLNEQMEIRKNFHEVVMKGLRKLDPVWAYEEDPEYWEWNKKLQTIQYESDVDKMLHEKKLLEHALKDIGTEMERISKELPEKKKELAEMKGE